MTSNGQETSGNPDEGASAPERSDVAGNSASGPLSGAWILVAGAVLLALFAWRLGSIPLLEPDEGRYAEIPREMLAAGDYVTPRLDGVLYFEKPALYYWLTAASIRVFGLNEIACRLPSTLLGLGGLLLAAALARSLAGRGSELPAAFMLGSSPVYFALSRVNSIDMTVSFFIGATLTCFWFAAESPPGGRRLWSWYGCFLAAALAVLSKGLIGVVIPGMVVFLYLAATRGWRLLRQVPWLGGLTLFTAVAVPWHVLVAQRNPSFLWFYFVHEHFLRYATNVADRQEPWWFLLAVLALGALPWTGLLAALAAPSVRKALEPRAHRGLLFLVLWAGFVLVFFSISKSKLVPYVLPSFLPLSVLAAMAWREATVRALGPAGRGVLGLAAALLATLFGAVLWMASGGGAQWTEGQELPAAVGFAAAAGALAASVAMFGAWRGRLRIWLSAAAAAALSLLLCLLLTAPLAGERRSGKAMAEYLAAHAAPQDRVISFAAYPQTLPVYLGRTIDVTEFIGELEFGIGQLSAAERAARFLSAEQLASVWASGATIHLVTEERAIDKLRRSGLDPGPVVFRAGRYVLFANHPSPG